MHSSSIVSLPLLKILTAGNELQFKQLKCFGIHLKFNNFLCIKFCIKHFYKKVMILERKTVTSSEGGFHVGLCIQIDEISKARNTENFREKTASKLI